MRPVFSYSGGKQRIASDIIRLFPKGYEKLHYIEPFAGSLAVLFRKEPPPESFLGAVASAADQVPENREAAEMAALAPIEIVSDLDIRVVAFFRQIKNNCPALYERCQATPYGQSEFEEARAIYKDPEGWTELEIAWGFWACLSHSFGYLGGSWGMAIAATSPSRTKIKNNKLKLLGPAHERLANVRILNEDAFSVIEREDSPNTLFYLDPPYPDSDQSPYSFGLSAEDFNTRLLSLLKGAKGKIVLSFYENKGLEIPAGWNLHKFPVRLLGGQAVQHGARRVELVATNF